MTPLKLLEFGAAAGAGLAILILLVGGALWIVAAGFVRSLLKMPQKVDAAMNEQALREQTQRLATAPPGPAMSMLSARRRAAVPPEQAGAKGTKT